MRFATFAPRAACALAVAAISALPAAAQEDEEDAVAWADAVEGLEPTDGLFDFYRDPETGALKMVIRDDQLDEEFVYASFTLDAPVESGRFRGAYQSNQVLVIKKVFDRLHLVARNTAYHFDPDSALARAADANRSDALIASIAIEAEDAETGLYLIDADPLFKSDKLERLKPATPPGARPDEVFDLGSLSDDKTVVEAVRGYPDNVDVIVAYSFENSNPKNTGSEAIEDARYVTIRLQHSFVAMPTAPFTPRLDDYRVGYLTERVTDLTSKSATPYRDIVNRWRLEKKDPEAEISEPVTPITFWIENTTPVEHRETIKDAALAWNAAFEAAGFRNAIEVKVQPDDAEWDAGDIRYNVLRWTSSPYPPFGGYGPSFTNPRTGEILGADIMLEYVYLTNRYDYGELFVEDLNVGSAQSQRQDWSHSGHVHRQTLFGVMAQNVRGASLEERARLVREGLYELVLHEIGHTLGLMHNMRASQLYGPREIHDPNVTGDALMGSVMDYAPINLAPDGGPQGRYFSIAPGPYDIWAIRFGYDPRLDDAGARAAHLARSLEPELAFGNDADDMRFPGKGTDPRVMVDDMSRDAVTYAVQRLALARGLTSQILERVAEPGGSYQRSRDAYLILTRQQADQADVISRYVGGVYVERAAVGQEGATRPYTPVPEAEQKAAMQALAAHVFAPDAFPTPETVLAHLQPQRRGFDFWGDPEDPALHARIAAIQGRVLDHLLHPNTLRRITDSGLYGNSYTAADMIDDLTRAIMTGDPVGGAPNSVRRNLQIAYARKLAAIVTARPSRNPTSSFDPMAQSAALGGLRLVGRFSRPSLFGFDDAAAAHRAHMRRIVSDALEAA